MTHGRRSNYGSALFLSNAGDLARVFQYELGIYAGVVPTDAEEKMWPRSAPGRSHVAERMALLDFLADLDFDVGKVKVLADETVAVVDEDRVALKEQIFSHNYRPVGRS
jgi:hypothetical protein